MTDHADATVHASAVLVGERAVLIRGPSGAGKSRLAFDLILCGRAGEIAPTELIGDDRVHLSASAGRVIVRPAPELEGLIEIRGLGIRSCGFIGEAAVGLLVDLAADDAERLPRDEALEIYLFGIKLPRIPVGRDFQALPLVVAALTTTKGYAPSATPHRRLPEGN